MGFVVFKKTFRRLISRWIGVFFKNFSGIVLRRYKMNRKKTNEICKYNFDNK